MQLRSFAKRYLKKRAKPPNEHNAIASLGSGEKLPAREAIFAEFGKD
jgi:hypothetical protein